MSIYSFSTQNNEYSVYLSGRNLVSIQFEDKNGHQGITGTGNAISVFSTVSEIVINHIKKSNPEIFTFEADSNEPTRVKLYTRMAKRLHQETGYPMIVDGFNSYVVFFFDRTRTKEKDPEWTFPA